jgi:hypothetical protein
VLYTVRRIAVRHYSPSTSTPTDEHSTIELYLRIGKEVFGVSFLSLDEAKKAARAINKTGRSVEIYEKLSGKVLERSAGWLEKRPMEATTIQTRLAQKAHQFETSATFCALCGLSLLDSLSLPLQCAGISPDHNRPGRPSTLTDAIDAAEHP